MTSLTQAPENKTVDPQRARALVVWSFAMIPVYVMVWWVLGWVSFALLGPLGLVEGELLLMAHNVWGWLLTIGFYAVMAAVPITGIVLGAKAVHSALRTSAVVAVVLNALVLLVALVQLASEIQLSYFPGIEPW